MHFTPQELFEIARYYCEQVGPEKIRFVNKTKEWFIFEVKGKDIYSGTEGIEELRLTKREVMEALED